VYSVSPAVDADNGSVSDNLDPDGGRGPRAPGRRGGRREAVAGHSDAAAEADGGDGPQLCGADAIGPEDHTLRRRWCADCEREERTKGKK